jgi:flagellar basal-body rod protein FlgC
MNYLQAFAISASGMAVEKARVDITAVNIANAQSTRGPDGAGFRPLRLISAARSTPEFSALLSAEQAGGAQSVRGAGGAPLQGAQIVSVLPVDTPPRLVLEPGHPDADERGFVAYPGISPLTEMVTLMTAVRVYEANVAALGAAKTMALKTLDLGN